MRHTLSYCLFSLLNRRGLHGDRAIYGCYMLLFLTLNHDLELSGYTTDISQRMKEGEEIH